MEQRNQFLYSGLNEQTQIVDLLVKEVIGIFAE
jgi:hypothetical protein